MNPLYTTANLNAAPGATNYTNRFSGQESLNKSAPLWGKKAPTHKHPASNTQPREHSEPLSHAGVTELVLPDLRNLNIVLPTLAHLSQQSQDRWITWFAPKGINKQLLTQYGFNLHNLRVIYAKSEDQLLWYVWGALAEGNSHTVVATLGKLSDKRLQQLEHAAQTGNSSAMLIRYR